MYSKIQQLFHILQVLKEKNYNNLQVEYENPADNNEYYRIYADDGTLYQIGYTWIDVEASGFKEADKFQEWYCLNITETPYMETPPFTIINIINNKRKQGVKTRILILF